MVRLVENADGNGTTATLPDGRSWGPFPSRAAAEGWHGLFGKAPDALATAKEVFEGAVQGDALFLVDASAVEFGMHPYREVLDWFVADDNGRVVADLMSGPVALDPATPVMVVNPERITRTRTLPPAQPAPKSLTLSGTPIASFRCRSRGEVVVARERAGFVVAWRPDARHRSSIPVLSLHTIEKIALTRAMREASSFEAPERSRSSRVRDYQMSAVYRWEQGIDRTVTRFGSIEECRAFARDVCDTLGIECPEISLGKSSLENHSYYSGLKGVVLQKDMQNSGTVLHELAHHVAGLRRSGPMASHGPLFVGVIAGMMARFAGADLDDALKAAAEAGLDVDEDAAREIASEPGYGMAT